jgi:putative ABC transport system ATP-binding protein
MIINIKNLGKIYKNGDIEVEALKNVNMSIDKGEFVSIMGPSGSGKSTLLNLVAGFDKPTSGTIAINGTDISSLSESDKASFRRKNIGFVFQSFCLLSDLSALENVMMPLLVCGAKYRVAREEALKCLETVGLADKASNKPEELSGGQQQRVAIARAVVTRPPVILADEPTGNLDSKNGESILALLAGLNRENGQTIIMVTHSEQAAEYSHRKIYFKDGLIDELSSKAGVAE